MPDYIFHFLVALFLTGIAFFASHIGHIDVAVTTLVFTLVFVGLGLKDLWLEDRR